MSKPARRARRRATSLPARVPERPLLERTLDTPHLPQVIPRLPPEVLHQVIQKCGLEDCGELVALAAPDQLRRVFDLDLWRAGQPGRDEEFDADRFGVWLEVLVESGADAAAQQLSSMDAELVITGLAQHARVFDLASTGKSGSEIGGYWLVPVREGSWDAIVTALVALAADHHEFFHRVMRGCRRLSNSAPEIDGLDDLLTDRDQAMFDLGAERDERREGRGFVTAAQARAFLQMSRRRRPGDVTSSHPVVRAYFQAIEPGISAHAEQEGHDSAVAGVVHVLEEAGVVVQRPRALLEGSHRGEPKFARLRAQLEFARCYDEDAHSTRMQEFAYLANTVAAGCSIQSRPFRLQEAFDAVSVTCNLGLDNWPHALTDSFLVQHGLIDVFQVGWTTLYENVCMAAAERLVDVLAELRCRDLETQAGLDVLRRELTQRWRAGEPWHAREAMDVIAILDIPAWTALLALIDECPVVHAAITAWRQPRARIVDAHAFEFISGNSHIARIREYLEALPEILQG